MLYAGLQVPEFRERKSSLEAFLPCHEAGPLLTQWGSLRGLYAGLVQQDGIPSMARPGRLGVPPPIHTKPPWQAWGDKGDPPRCQQVVGDIPLDLRFYTLFRP